MDCDTQKTVKLKFVYVFGCTWTYNHIAYGILRQEHPSRQQCSASPVFVIFLLVQYLTASSTFCLWCHREGKNSFWHEEFSHKFSNNNGSHSKPIYAKRLWPLQDGFHVIFGVPAIPLEVAPPLAALLAKGDQSLQLGLEWRMVSVNTTFVNPLELQRFRLHTTKGHTWIFKVGLIQTGAHCYWIKIKTFNLPTHEPWARRTPEGWAAGFLFILGADSMNHGLPLKKNPSQGYLFLFQCSIGHGESYMIYTSWNCKGDKIRKQW